jgi:hypothetical protein
MHFLSKGEVQLQQTANHAWEIPMNWKNIKACLVVVIVPVALVLVLTTCVKVDEKIGVLFMSTGLSEEYSFDWRTRRSLSYAVSPRELP